MSNKVKIEVYDIGTQVWAISRATLSHEEKGEHYHVAIMPVIIDYISYSLDKMNRAMFEYGVTTLKGKDWGDTVKGEDLHHDFDVLISKMKNEWINTSEKF